MSLTDDFNSATNSKGEMMSAKDQGAGATKGRWLTIPRSLSFVFNGEDVLLMKRSPHKRIFPNRYNGVGGHIERDEDIYVSAMREIKEETGLDVERVQLCGIHNIDSGGENGIMVFVFSAWTHERELSYDHDEGTLEWIAINRLDSLDLVEDLPIILSRIVNRRSDLPPYFAHVSYDKNDQIVLKFSGE